MRELPEGAYYLGWRRQVKSKNIGTTALAALLVLMPIADSPCMGYEKRTASCGISAMLITAGTTGGKAEQLYSQARTLTRQHRYAEALPILQQANQNEPRSYDIHYELGWTWEHLNQPGKALPEYKAALELCPQGSGPGQRQMLSDALQSMAAMYTKLGHQAEAISLLERAATVDPDSKTIHYSLGIKYQKTGKNEKAIEHLRRALQIKPEIDSMLAISDSFLDIGKNDEAVGWAQRATAAFPNSSDAHYKLAYAYRHTGNPQKAIEEYVQALRLKPDDTPVIRAIANCYSDLGKKKEAVVWYQEYLRATPRASDYKETSDLVTNLVEEIKKQPVEDDPQGPDFYLSAISGEQPRRWPPDKLPIKVYIDPGRQVAGMRISNVRILIESFDAWMEASQGRLSYQLVPRAEVADIVCDWTSNPADVTSNGTEYQTGSSRITEVDKGQGIFDIKRAKIRILTIEKKGQPMPVGDMKGTCLHEIGHALGLHGHSPNSRDIMYFQEIPAGLSALSKRDKATLLRFYGQYPVIFGFIGDSP